MFFFFPLLYLSLQQSEDKAREKQKASENPTASKTQRNKISKKLGGGGDKDFKPIAGLF